MASYTKRDPKPHLVREETRKPLSVCSWRGLRVVAERVYAFDSEGTRWRYTLETRYAASGQPDSVLAYGYFRA